MDNILSFDSIAATANGNRLPLMGESVETQLDSEETCLKKGISSFIKNNKNHKKLHFKYSPKILSNPLAFICAAS